MPECGSDGRRLFDEGSPLHIHLIKALEIFARGYGEIHAPITFSLCIIGLLANMLHIMILTRPVMKRSTVNRLLAYMAIFDAITMADYLLYLIRFSFFVDPENPPYGYGYAWICYLLGHVVLSICLHSISLYLSVTTAFIRLTAISRLQSSIMKPQMAWKMCSWIFLFMSLMVIPTFYVHQIVESEAIGEFIVELPQENDTRCSIFIINLWLTGVFFKVIPCILLIIFTAGLLWKLHLNKIAHEKIASKQAFQIRCAQADRTTTLLILLLIIFLATELPQGILALLHAIYTEDVNQLYSHLGEFFDLLSLINGLMCFILYPCISTQYRETFSLLIARLRSNYSAPYKSSSVTSRFIIHSECRTVDLSEHRFLEISEVNL